MLMMTVIMMISDDSDDVDKDDVKNDDNEDVGYVNSASVDKCANR